MLHGTCDRFGGPSCDTGPPCSSGERGRCLPTVPTETVPLTPLSLLPLSRSARAPSRRDTAHLAVRRLFGRRERPRSPGRSARERVPLSVTRGAFHRQGALRRIRWRHLSRGCPGPTTRSPLARCPNRWMAFSRHPGTSPIPRPGSTTRSGSRRSFRRNLRREPFRASDEASTRSLFTPAAPLLGGPTRGRIRDPTPPDDFCNCIRRTGHGPHELTIPRVREGGRDLRPGSDASRGRRAPKRPSSVTRGEPAFVHVEGPRLRFLLQSRFARRRYRRPRG